jgi:hypothetical protein
MMQPRQRQAALEIQAWTVTGTPASEMRAGLMEAYRTRCPCEKDSFAAALIDRMAEILSSSSAENASLAA